MTNERFDESDVMRVLELADQHLEEAENIIWETSSDTTSGEAAAELETLTAHIWEIQHTIYDLQRELGDGQPDRDDEFVY